MDYEQKRKVIECLVEFVERASSKNATSEEIAVLPEVAKALLEINRSR